MYAGQSALSRKSGWIALDTVVRAYDGTMLYTELVIPTKAPKRYNPPPISLALDFQSAEPVAL